MSIGKFIIFEGNEGTGKSTHISFATDYLKKNKIECVVTRFLVGTKFGESIRDILLDSNQILIQPLKLYYFMLPEFIIIIK